MTMTDRGVQALSNKPRNTFGSWTVTDSVEICDGIRSCQITWCSVFDLAFFRPSALPLHSALRFQVSMFAPSSRIIVFEG
jgi:hypothetical protein